MIQGFASYAGEQFALSEVVEGAPLRKHLEAAWERSGVMPTRLANGPKLPAGCEQLWKDFLELHQTRPSSMDAERIGYRQIAEWQAFYGVKLAGWQIKAIQRADDAFMASRVKPS